jgi:hypothetical protein
MLLHKMLLPYNDYSFGKKNICFIIVGYLKISSTIFENNWEIKKLFI